MIKIYNTLSKKKENLVVRNGSPLKIFVCGPTVYDFPHLGHAKTYTQFDFIVKFLRFKGISTIYLQNITDIDDKIIKRAKENGESTESLSERFEGIYKEDMLSLGNDSVDKYARATDHIPQIQSQVEALLEKGYAYAAPDGVYYETSKFPDYGKLSGRLEICETDAQSRIDNSAFKRGWNDFCLWKFKKVDEISWPSPFGEGRPGWHIEDTAITEAEFGPQYDIHGGAIDLIVPHHECEIAQMESASGKKPLVRYWMHTGFLNFDNEKMSKSTGNFKTIRDALKAYKPRVIRYLMVRSHYRSSIEFDGNSLKDAANSLKRIDEYVFNADQNYDDVYFSGVAQNVISDMNAALEDDLNSPRALATLFDFIRNINRDGRTKGRFALKPIVEFDAIYGCFLTLNNALNDDLTEEIESLIRKRNECKLEKKYKEADTIRAQLNKLGIEIIDSLEKTKWRKIN